MGLLLFLVIVVVEHAVNSSLDPTTHRISEYVHGHLGWLMNVGFAAWAVSLAMTAAVANWLFRSKGVSVSLLVAALGMIVTACFATQTSAGELPPGASLTISGRLHDLGSGLVIVGLTFAVALSLRRGGPRKMRQLTLLFLLVALPAIFALIAIGDDLAGVRQRVLVGLACAWQLLLLMDGRSVRVQANPTSGGTPSIR